MHFDGTDASTTFTDSSASAHALTAYGNAQVDTAQSKFGGASGLFDGTGDAVCSGDSNDWNLGTADFTVDFWTRLNGTGTTYFFELGSYGEGSGMELQLFGGNLTVVTNGNTTMIQRAWSPSTGTWYHIAITRSGTSLRLFIDGTQQGAAATDSTDIQGGTTGFHMGIEHPHAGSGLNGWLDEFRVSKGIARWTANFTPPTAAYS